MSGLDTLLEDFGFWKELTLRLKDLKQLDLSVKVDRVKAQLLS